MSTPTTTPRIPDNAVMTAELRSTTVAAPIRFKPVGGSNVRINLEDGSNQVYDRRDLMIAVVGMHHDDGMSTLLDLHRYAEAVRGDTSGSAVFATPMRVAWHWDGQDIVHQA